MARDDPQIQAKAARLRERYLERVAPHLVQEFGCPEGGDMRTLRRLGLQRVAELRQALGTGGRSGHRGVLPPPPPQKASLQRRVDRLYSEYAAASTQLEQLGQSPQTAAVSAEDELEEVEVPAGWSTLMYANVEGSIIEVSIDEVEALLRAGEITEDTYVIVEGMPTWETFAQFVKMYHLEDELLGSSRASPDTRAHYRGEMVSEALGSEPHGGRPPLLSSASLQSVSQMEEMKERRRSMLREASQTTITVLSPRCRTGSVEGSPPQSPLSALSPSRRPDPQTARRPLHQLGLSPIPGSGGSAASAATVASAERVNAAAFDMGESGRR